MDREDAEIEARRKILGQHGLRVRRASYEVVYDAGTHVDVIYCPLCPWPAPGVLPRMMAVDAAAWDERHGPTSDNRPQLAVAWEVTSTLMAIVDAADPLNDAYVWTWRVECDKGDGHVLMTAGDLRGDDESPMPPTTDDVRQWLSDRDFEEVDADE